MNISVIKTNVIYPSVKLLTDIIDTHITTLEEKSVVAISSKIVSLCEGSVIDSSTTTKDALVEQHAQYYLDRIISKYNSHVNHRT